MTNFEKGAQEVPAEKSPAEKNPEEIRKKNKVFVSDWVLGMENEMPREEWNRLGTILIKYLDFVDEGEIRSCYAKGIEGFTQLADLANVRGTAAELERSAENLKAGQDALDKKTGKDQVEKGQPYPELKESPTEERKKEVGPSEPFPEE